MWVQSEEKIPIKIWADEVEEGAMEQAMNLADLPFAFRHIALMPDVHQGYGMPIGGVMAAKGVVSPNCVGVDIGCGVCAVKLNWRAVERGRLQQFVDKIRQCIPTGFHWHDSQQDISGVYFSEMSKERLPIVVENFEKAEHQLGTLGGGNHFIEIQKGSDNYIWIMIHSGSRNLGKQVADHYNKIAKRLNEQWCSSVDPKWDLAFLPMGCDEATAYIREMNYCVAFAKANRKLMMDRVVEIFASDPGITNVLERIDIAHNYAAMENHFGQNVMVHRKGATRAGVGEFGIVPGSQGTKSYIVKGKGNRDSFESCAHGAGRCMGRKQAKRELNLEEQQGLMNEKGIIHSINSEKDLDEAPGAYKNIDEVMQQQQDLVEIVVELEPMAVIKA